MGTMRHLIFAPAAIVAGVVLLAGCGGRKPADAAAPRVETMSSGPVSLTVTVDPPAVDYGKTVIVTLRATAPSNIHVQIPSLGDRLQGFTLTGEFDKDPAVRGEQVTFEHSAQLTPVLSAEHRIAPMAISCTDRSRKPPASFWFPTRPIVLAPAPILPGKPPRDIADIRGPTRVLPPFRTVVIWLLGATLLAALGYAAWRVSRRVKRAIQLALMSPKERALLELRKLMARKLVEGGQVKEFYFELTMIVRRYIERAHRIRAPEQTTEEFLAAASVDPRFTRDVLGRLRDFLQAADLVKYAAYRPEPEVVEKAVETARRYIETDTAEAEAAAGGTREEGARV